jgi:hypothetical protein
MSVSTQPSSIIPTGSLSIRAVRDDGSQPGLLDLVAQGIRVVSFVRDDRRARWHFHRRVVEGRLQEFLFTDIGGGDC